MTFIETHRESQQLAMDAAVAVAGGDYQRAEELYLRAGDLERQALAMVEPGKTRTIGIAVVSAVSLLYKGKGFDRAEKLATDWLSKDGLPSFAANQLRDLLQTIWNDRARVASGVRFVGNEIVVRLKGGEVIHGAAPLNLIVDKVEEVRKLYVRVAEYVNQQPLRRRGNPAQAILRDYRPYILQSQAASYQFAVRMQAPDQIEQFAENEPRIADVSNKFLDIMRASASGPEAMASVIPEEDYRKTFMQLTRELAPDGKRVEEIVFSGGVSPAEPPTVLSSATKREINNVLKAVASAPPKTKKIDYVGTLRALNLDNDWVIITTADGEHKRIYGAGDFVDDVIGPMVNREVIIEASVDEDGKVTLLDIQLNE